MATNHDLVDLIVERLRARRPGVRVPTLDAMTDDDAEALREAFTSVDQFDGTAYYIDRLMWVGDSGVLYDLYEDVLFTDEMMMS